MSSIEILGVYRFASSFRVIFRCNDTLGIRLLALVPFIPSVVRWSCIAVWHRPRSSKGVEIVERAIYETRLGRSCGRRSSWPARQNIIEEFNERSLVNYYSSLWLGVVRSPVPKNSAHEWQQPPLARGASTSYKSRTCPVALARSILLRTRSERNTTPVYPGQRER